MSDKLKTFHVTFTSIADFSIDVEATSAELAIAAARHLYIEEDADDPRFRELGGDAFADASAEEIAPAKAEGGAV